MLDRVACRRVKLLIICPGAFVFITRSEYGGTAVMSRTAFVSDRRQITYLILNEGSCSHLR